MRRSLRVGIAVSALVAGVVLGVLTALPAQAAHDRNSRPSALRTWPSPIVLLTVDGVVPRRPSVVLVISPELDTRYRVHARGKVEDAGFSFYPFLVAVVSAATFGAVRAEALRRARDSRRAARPEEGARSLPVTEA